jgi:hypothetical protein
MQIKNRYDIRFKVGIGPIELGMSHQEVIAILGEPDFSSEDRHYLENIHHSRDLHIDYEINTGICKAIEVTNDAELIYNGGNLFDLSWEEMFHWLLEIDPELEEDVGNWTSHKYRIATGYCLDQETDLEIVESILIFAENYWTPKEERQAESLARIAAMPSLEEQAKELGLENFF